MKRAPWQCNVVAEFRDEPSGYVPVPLYSKDGTIWRTIDIKSELVARLEKVAKKKRWSFRRLFHTALVEGAQRLEEELGF